VQVDGVVGDDHARRAVQLPEGDLLARGAMADDAVLAGDAHRARGRGQAGCAHDGAEDAAPGAQRAVPPESSADTSVSTCRRVSRPPIRVTIS
jgi:hypothetical protein